MTEKLPKLPKQQQNLFDFLVKYAKSGERCPTSDQLKYHQQPHNLTELASNGYIRIEVFVRNWRVVTILAGAHAGKATAPCPHGGSLKPYRIIDANGDSMSVQRQKTRRAKTAPTIAEATDGTIKSYREPTIPKLPWDD